MNRQDLRDLNAQTQELQAALDDLEELADHDENENVTVDPAAYAEAQERAKAAIAEIVHASDDAVDRTDVLEDDEGNVRVTLPNAALARSGGSADLPEQPSSGGQ